MRRKQNVIIFSAGESVRNGNVEYIRNKLEEKDIFCFDWRLLFNQAHNTEQIALLPSLSKKIPTFDFALIVAEGVDTVKLRGNEEQIAIRDNVIFELGLCVMALGVERVILLAEESVRIPEDLIGVGKIGIEYVTFLSLQNVASSKVKMNHKMKADMLEIKERYAKKRKTEIVDAEAIVIKKPEIKEEKVYALVNRFGYIKLVDEATYERNKENIPSDYRYVFLSIVLLADCTKRIKILREKKEQVIRQLNFNEEAKKEMDRIKSYLAEDRAVVDKFDDSTVRRLVNQIVVSEDLKLTIYIKGGYEIEEQYLPRPKSA